MQDTEAPWTPTPGESVLVKATGEGGEVVDIIGGGDARHVVIAFPAVRSPGEPAVTHAAERREYRIDELAPA